MVAGERQAGNDRLRRPLRHRGARRQGVADDAVILLGVDRALEELDPGAAGRTLRDAVAETLDVVGMAGAVRIAQRDEEPAAGRRIVAVIAPAPGIDVDGPVRCHDEVAGMADIVGEDGGAEAGRERDAAIIPGAAGRRRRFRLAVRRKRRCAGRHQQRSKKGCRSRHAAAMPVAISHILQLLPTGAAESRACSARVVAGLSG